MLEKGLNRLSVGLGMIPRGEVGLIFAAEGARLIGSDGTPVINQNTFSAIVVMVMITTMVTPPLLKWSMNRKTLPAEPRLTNSDDVSDSDGESMSETDAEVVDSITSRHDTERVAAVHGAHLN